MDILSHNVLPFLAMIVVLIVVHELGHYITAKVAGVKVLEFGIGYPPRLWGIKRGETEYTINALPPGGLVPPPCAGGPPRARAHRRHRPPGRRRGRAKRPRRGGRPPAGRCHLRRRRPQRAERRRSRLP